VATEHGSVTLPVEITPMPDRVVWLPGNSAGGGIRRDLRAGHGTLVTLRSAEWTVLAAGPSGDIPTLASFGHDPWWLVIIKVLVIFVFLLLGTLFTIWAERRVVGRMQQRPGP